MWTAANQGESINMRELRYVRLLLHGHFYKYVSRPHMCQIIHSTGDICKTTEMIRGSDRGETAGCMEETHRDGTIEGLEG